MKIPLFPRPPATGIIWGLAGSARAIYLLRLGTPLLFLSRDEEEAALLHGDLRFFAPRSAPRWPRAATNVASPEAALGPALDTAALPTGAVGCGRGDLDPEFLAELLAALGYRRGGLIART